jgi:outer membrane protein OmpA-like peptidoglycan-associated protein
MQSTESTSEIPSGVIDRADQPSGFWATAWPLLALALMSALALHACVPKPPSTSAEFDPTAAAKSANEAAVKALAANPGDRNVDAVLKLLTTGAVYFEDGGIELSADAKAWLAVVARRLLLLPAAARIEVRSHTDGSGDVDYDATLTQQRADAVRSYLVAQGVPADRLSARGMGDSQPIASSETPEGRFRNRRVEFVPVR